MRENEEGKGSSDVRLGETSCLAAGLLVLTRECDGPMFWARVELEDANAGFIELISERVDSKAN